MVRKPTREDLEDALINLQDLGLLLVFSLEMPGVKLFERMASMTIGWPGREIEDRARMEDPKVSERFLEVCRRWEHVVVVARSCALAQVGPGFRRRGGGRGLPLGYLAARAVRPAQEGRARTEAWRVQGARAEEPQRTGVQDHHAPVRPGRAQDSAGLRGAHSRMGHIREGSYVILVPGRIMAERHGGATEPGLVPRVGPIPGTGREGST